MSTSKKIFYVVIVCLLAAILGCFTGYKLGTYEDKGINSDKSSESDNQDISSDTTNLPEWATYLLSKDIIKIELKNFSSCYVGTDGEEGSSTIITKDDLKDIFLKSTENKLMKSYVTGIGGTCGKYLVITYDNYTLNLLEGNYLLSVEDTELLNLLNNTSYVTEDTEHCSSSDASDCYFNLNLADYLQDYIK